MEINKLELWQCAHKLDMAMRDLGIAQIRYSTDQRELADAVAVMEKSRLGEHFNRSLNTLPGGKLMWISAYDREGNIAALIACRLDDTGEWSLQRFLLEHFGRVIQGSDRDGAAELDPASCAFAANIAGRCVYIGEAYSSKEWRRRGLATLLVKYSILISWDEWKPQICYAWIRRRQIETGTAARWGFTETYETPLLFKRPPLDADWSNTFFVGIRRIGVHQMIQTIRGQAVPMASNSKQETLTPPLF